MRLTRTRTSASDPLSDALATVSALQTRSATSRNYGRIFTGILFALFVITLLMAVTVGSSVYRAVYMSGRAADDYRSSLSLLSNIVKANDTYDSISVGEGPEGPSLVLTETVGSSTYETRIYAWDGSLYQDYVIPGADFNQGNATEVARTGKFEFALTDNLLILETDQGTITLFLRTSQSPDEALYDEQADGGVPEQSIDFEVIGEEIVDDDGMLSATEMTADVTARDADSTETVIDDGFAGVTSNSEDGAI